MNCPVCEHETSRVKDTRRQPDGSTERRRACEACGASFRTTEVLSPRELRVIKSDGRVTDFRPASLRRAIEQASVRDYRSERGQEELDMLVAQVLRRAHSDEGDLGRDEHGRISSRDIGEIVMRVLKAHDPLSAVRFALVAYGRQDRRGSQRPRFHDAVGFINWITDEFEGADAAPDLRHEPLFVLKRSGDIANFDRSKITESIRIAAKGQVAAEAELDELAETIARRVADVLQHHPIVTSGQIAHVILNELSRLPTYALAYLRFASTVKHYARVSDFALEARALIRRHGAGEV